MSRFVFRFPAPSSYPLSSALTRLLSAVLLPPSFKRQATAEAPTAPLELCETKHSAHAGPCPTSLSPALQSSLLGTPLLLWASPPSARSPPPLASPRCPHLFYFSPQPSHHAQSTPPHSCRSSLGDVPRSLPRAPLVQFRVTSIPCWECPLCLALPTACLDYWGAGHPSCLVPQSRPAATRLLLPKASPVSTVKGAL